MNEKSVKEAIRDMVFEMLIFMISTANAALGFSIFIYGTNLVHILGLIVFAISLIALLLLLKLMADNTLIIIDKP